MFSEALRHIIFTQSRSELANSAQWFKSVIVYLLIFAEQIQPEGLCGLMGMYISV